MDDEYVEPIGPVLPKIPVRDSPGARAEGTENRRVTVEGEIVAVHRKSGHKEGRHLLDKSVGAEEHDEIVVRVRSGDLGHLVGKRVRITYRT
ncbi:MAG: hypothetical protein IIB38_08980 [Candidatus Hydrogenedentes bacterium]|nr:hypothetical protein [Candidatus Hydrogenedentota bacterium]